MTEILPIDTKFQLGAEITAEQEAFLDHYGFLHFRGVAKPEEVALLRAEHDRLEERWIAENKRWLYGIPLFWGTRETGKPIIHRIPFTSRFSEPISQFVREPRFEPVRRLVGENARIGEHEMDGVVINRYMNVKGSNYDRIGWHTDGLRDLFYLRMPSRMLNIGIHLDDVPKEEGGLRIIPGTHKQGFFSTLLGKVHFVSHKPDPREISIESFAGDLTVHDGRTWHRVQRSPKYSQASQRRTMFVPYLTGPYAPKTEESKTPAYHHLGQALRRLRSLPYRAVEGREPG